MTIKTKFVSALSVLAVYFLPVIATAAVFEVEAAGEYIMGDNDTKIESRRIALEHARRSVAERLQSHLEATQIIKNHFLSRNEISCLTAAILQAVVVSEEISLRGDKTTRIQINLKASVDTGALEILISELENDTQREKQLAKLLEDNHNLVLKLDNLSRQLNAQNATGLKRLREQREELFAHIDVNNNALRIALDKESLPNLALKSLNNLEKSKAKIDRIMQIIGNSIQIKLSEPQVRHRGENSELIVQFSWDTYRETLRGIIPLLDDICSGTRMGLKNSIDSIDAGILLCDFKDTSNKEELYSYLYNYSIGITINAGLQSKYFPVLKYRTARFKGHSVFNGTMTTAELDGITNTEAKVSIESDKIDY